jgi:hypothetical protein
VRLGLGGIRWSVAEGLGYELLLSLSEVSEVVSCSLWAYPNLTLEGLSVKSKEGSQGHESSAIIDVIVKLAKLSI